MYFIQNVIITWHYRPISFWRPFIHIYRNILPKHSSFGMTITTLGKLTFSGFHDNWGLMSGLKFVDKLLLLLVLLIKRFLVLTEGSMFLAKNHAKFPLRNTWPFRQRVTASKLVTQNCGIFSITQICLLSALNAVYYPEVKLKRSSNRYSKQQNIFRRSSFTEEFMNQI